MRREVFECAVRNLSGQGFKILLDLLASSPKPVRIKELPYEFCARRFGESKLDTLVAWEFCMLLADKLVGHLVPVRFALFIFVGALGLVVHLAVLRVALSFPALDFTKSQAVATLVAMTSNFFLNNLFTYRDQRLSGLKLLRGLVSFYLICAVGAIGNVGIASYVFAADQQWWIAGIAGAIVGSVWDYAVSSVFTWRRGGGLLLALCPQLVAIAGEAFEHDFDHGMDDRSILRIRQEILFGDVGLVWTTLGVLSEQMVEGLVFRWPPIRRDRLVPLLGIIEDRVDVEDHAAERVNPVPDDLPHGEFCLPEQTLR